MPDVRPTLEHGARSRPRRTTGRRREMRLLELEVLGFGVAVLAPSSSRSSCSSPSAFLLAGLMLRGGLDVPLHAVLAPPRAPRDRRGAALGAAIPSDPCCAHRSSRLAARAATDTAGRPVVLATLEAPLTPSRPPRSRSMPRSRAGQRADRRERRGVEPRTLRPDARLRHDRRHPMSRSHSARLRTSRTRSASRSSGFGSGRPGRWTPCSSSWPSAQPGLLVVGPDPSRIRPTRATQGRRGGSATRSTCLVWLPE